ncbi:hypothetical protein ACHAO9_011084 [Fusarium lateritium]
MLNVRQAIRSRAAPRQLATRSLGTFRVPPIRNEPNPTYAKGSQERQKLQEALDNLKQRLPIHVPLKISGQTVSSKVTGFQPIPSAHATTLAEYAIATPEQVSEAIEKALAAKENWANTSFENRAAVFLRVAELIAGKYRYEIMAATMLGQGKNIWQAEIDSAAESCDFYSKIEYRPLEGFVYAISPFNFTAISANLTAAPAIMGNVKILEEAGLLDGVIQFLPGDTEKVIKAVLNHPKFGALYFTGSTDVFRDLYGKIGDGIRSSLYESYPCVVSETGGKNFYLVHKSADIRNAVMNTIRGAFEYQGQKCSAISRLFIPESIWPEFKKELVVETEKLQVGPPESFKSFIGPVIHERSWEKLNMEVELLAGGSTDKSRGWFIQPTIFQIKNPSHNLMKDELFGPVLSVYVYPDGEYEQTMELIDKSTKFALTGAVFARDRTAIAEAEKGLRQSAGNFYINCKSSGAVVGHQPFGGGRASGTNDKATSINLLSRFTSIRSMKEDLVGADEVDYPSNEV